MDFSLASPALIGSVSAAAVPRYILYGDASARPDWFVNVEPLDQRCRERGWVIAPHTHPRFMQMVVVDEGGGEMSVEGETIPFSSSSILVVPPHRIHGFRYLEATTGWVLTIEINYLADLLVRAPALKTVLDVPGVFDLTVAILPSIAEEISGLAQELAEMRPGNAIGAEIKLLSVLLLLLRNWPASDGQRRPPADSRSALVERYKELVERRFREQPQLTEVAEELKVSVSQLRLACKTVAGVSPLELMHDRIAGEAKRCLIYTTMSIAEIADWLGFADGAYFSRFFAKAAGKSPTNYRRKQDFSGDALTSPETAALTRSGAALDERIGEDSVSSTDQLVAGCLEPGCHGHRRTVLLPARHRQQPVGIIVPDPASESRSAALCTLSRQEHREVDGYRARRAR
ncbi:helix-turn-helix domain-containing protein [Sphingomonas oryzagri]|uniref:Helix-turn-helix domain-containing protein n=1 Tax=Sphingomonas oryzagri TaxID=3042314 RepID=A0ABT6N1V0_9SPHN|nr:helix-turn-helix domain-containing protein [Sphingomonas oryzagri]MDH7639263.1 helix-turn-helix domain-containing protein [Sphingomonas oryzagri]